MHSVWKSQEKVSFNIASVASYVYIRGQKLIRNAKIEKFKCDFLGNFKTLCQYLIYDKKWPSAHFMLQRAEIPDINPLGCIINKQKKFQHLISIDLNNFKSNLD